MKKTTLFCLAALCFALPIAACHAQEKKANTQGNTDIQCPTKAQGAEYDYVKIIGSVTYSRVDSSTPPIDCTPMTKECNPYKGKAFLFFKVKPHVISSVEKPREEIYITTPYRPKEELEKINPPLMEMNKQYGFCARSRKQQAVTAETKSFILQDFSTVQEIPSQSMGE